MSEAGWFIYCLTLYRLQRTLVTCLERIQVAEFHLQISAFLLVFFYILGYNQTGLVFFDFHAIRSILP